MSALWLSRVRRVADFADHAAAEGERWTDPHSSGQNVAAELPHSEQFPNGVQPENRSAALREWSQLPVHPWPCPRDQ